jgi:hypothetical protein
MPCNSLGKLELPTTSNKKWKCSFSIFCPWALCANHKIKKH